MSLLSGWTGPSRWGVSLEVTLSVSPNDAFPSCSRHDRSSSAKSPLNFEGLLKVQAWAFSVI